MKVMSKRISLFILSILILISFLLSYPSSIDASQNEEIRKQYVEFFGDLFEVMVKNYYYPLEKEDFVRFILWFDQKIYEKVKRRKSLSPLVKWRSAAYMVDFLKQENDTFSAFFPPKPAKKFEKDVLGKKIDLGIEGVLTDEGFLVKRIEPRTDAAKKGLLPEDLIQKINGVEASALSQKTIEELLRPLEDTTVRLVFKSHKTGRIKEIQVISKEYYKQSVFMVPVDVKDIYCLEIRTFNRKTSEDLEYFLSQIKKKKPKGLVLDLRDNPGGPPLAAREISAFFLPAKEDFAYFQKRGRPKAELDVPKIPKKKKFDGSLAILVNEGSGSASELFSGVLQKRDRAVLFGQTTAGKVLLKSMFHFDDESMVLLVTGRGFFPDGEVFSFDGLGPDYPIQDQDIDLVHFAANYLKEHMN